MNIGHESPGGAKLEKRIQPEELAELVREARSRTLSLVEDLTDEQLNGPRLAIVNPLRWEIGHVAWFQEKWTLRKGGGLPSIRPDSDSLYDSAAVAHDTRWDLPLPSREQTVAYLNEVRDRLLRRLAQQGAGEAETYFVLLSVFHEDMHTEAITYTRQTLGCPAPGFIRAGRRVVKDAGPLPGDAKVAGGSFLLGATHDGFFVFDNEKWAHPVTIASFSIARAPVTQAEFAGFVEAGGYSEKSCWTDAGWRWRESAQAELPLYWRRAPTGEWLRREFDQWLPLEPHRPVLHVNWYEADAYCRWAGRRLPSEAEWEAAASWDADAGRKRRYPWGDEPPAEARAHLDWGAGEAMGCLDVGGLPEGDSWSGCRQMIGNVWEWTSSDFVPYPGFVVDPYKEYSQPWFYTHKVLRGGCWTTRSRLLRNTWRNFYEPHRRDVWSGFRTCAADR